MAGPKKLPPRDAGRPESKSTGLPPRKVSARANKRDASSNAAPSVSLAEREKQLKKSTADKPLKAGRKTAPQAQGADSATSSGSRASKSDAAVQFVPPLGPEPSQFHKSVTAKVTITHPDGSRRRVEVGMGRKHAQSERLRLFQIYYEPWHLELLDPDLEPFDNSGISSEFYEFDVFIRLADQDDARAAELWGAVSWRFSEKTGMSGKDLRDVISANPGYDVYYCNPYPHNEALFHNMWLQGETCHPRFLEVAEAVFAAANLPEVELRALEQSEIFSAANYFVGTNKFWSLYLAFVKRVIGLADSRMSDEMKQLLHSSEADQRFMHNGATYVSFVVERLFPLFMKTAGRRLKKFKYPLPSKEAETNIHLRLLREMRDVAHKTNSAWLAACWINYRNLYFAQSNGKEWCAKYLRTITPTTVNFG